MDFAKVSIEVRKQAGKGGAHKVRAKGLVPGILYGHKAAPVTVAFDEKTLLKSLDKDRRRNTVFALTVADGARSETVTAMIRDAQIHPISRRLVHVDFLRVDPDEEIHVEVPLHLIGKAVGVINGGQLHQSVHNLRVAAKPGAIPNHVDLDVSALDIGDALHVSDLKLPPGVRALIEAKEALASVVAPKAEKVEETAVAVEGAVAAEGGAPAEGAASAEGAAAGSAGAAGAKPAAGAKLGAGAKPAQGGAAKKEGGEKKAK